MDKIIKGAIFCQVKRIKTPNHSSPSQTIGNQKCKGAAPIFINREIFIKVSILKYKSKDRGIDTKITAIKKILDARACTKKYFKDASVISIDLDLLIKGINESKLISNPNHILNQEEELITIIVPRIKVNKNK